MEEREHSSQHQIRSEKVEALSQKGVMAWPEGKEVTSTTQRAKDSFLAHEESDVEYALAGRILGMRGHGKTFFITIQDRSGQLQLYVRKDTLPEEDFAIVSQSLDLGDIIWCSGTLFKTKVGEVTLRAQAVTLVSKCLHPLPEKYHGLTSTEQRYRQRYLDTMTNEESRQKFISRSHIIQTVREQLLEKDFLEVETPMLHPISGGAIARPFVTHHNAYDMDLFLRIAPELYLKRLVIGGFDRVFEINRSFRNEGVSTRHNPEFTMIEFYMAYGNYHQGMNMTESIIAAAAKRVHGSTTVAYGEHTLEFSSPFKRMRLVDSLVEIGGFDREVVESEGITGLLAQHDVTGVGDKSLGERQLLLFEECVEKKLIQPTFITDYPIEVSPLARRKEGNASVAARFELFIAGMEVSNGYNELNNPIDQAQRFEEQVKGREKGDDEAHLFDSDYIKALEHGLPPTVGVGIGIDRLVMLLTNTTSIKDVILFPTMKRLDG